MWFFDCSCKARWAVIRRTTQNWEVGDRLIPWKRALVHAWGNRYYLIPMTIATANSAPPVHQHSWWHNKYGSKDWLMQAIQYIKINITWSLICEYSDNKTPSYGRPFVSKLEMNAMCKKWVTSRNKLLASRDNCDTSRDDLHTSRDNCSDIARWLSYIAR